MWTWYAIKHLQLFVLIKEHYSQSHLYHSKFPSVLLIASLMRAFSRRNKSTQQHIVEAKVTAPALRHTWRLALLSFSLHSFSQLLILSTRIKWRHITKNFRNSCPNSLNNYLSIYFQSTFNYRLVKQSKEKQLVKIIERKI